MQEGNPQLEDGFTRIANELLDAVMRAPFAGSEQRVLLAVIRLTYGYNRKEDAISYGQVASLTGLDRRVVIRAMNSLLEQRVLTRKDRGATSPAVWAVQKRYQVWNVAGDTTATSTSDNPATSDNPDTSTASDNRDTSTSDASVTSTSDKIVTHQRQRKTVKTEQREGRKRPAPPMHPALATYREATHLNVSLDWQQDVIDAVGDAEEDVAFWRQVIKDYTGTYTNKANVKAMLDYYKRRELPGTSKRNRTSTTTGIPALDPPIYLDVADSGFAHGEIQRIQEERRRAAEAATCAP